MTLEIQFIQILSYSLKNLQILIQIFCPIVFTSCTFELWKYLLEFLFIHVFMEFPMLMKQFLLMHLIFYFFCFPIHLNTWIIIVIIIVVLHQGTYQLFWMNGTLNRKLPNRNMRCATKNDEAQKVFTLSNFQIDDICLPLIEIKVYNRLFRDSHSTT